MMEVSTGLFADAVEKPGTFEGVSYTLVATNIKTDHIAVLPNAIGACSIADGCGALRANEDKVVAAEHADCDTCADAKALTLREKVGEAIRTLGAKIKGNEISYDETERQIRSLLRAENTSSDWYPYIVETYSSYFIYSDDDNKLYKRGYTNIDDVVALSGESSEVIRVIIYEPIGLIGNSAVLNLSKDKFMNEVESKVVALIANADNTFTEANRADLIAYVEAAVDKADADTKVDKADGDGEVKDDAVADVTANALSDAQLATLNRLQADEDVRIEAMRAVVANANPDVDAKAIAAMSDETIKAFAQAIKPKADFSGKGGVVGNSGDEVKTYPPVLVGNFNKKKEVA